MLFEFATSNRIIFGAGTLAKIQDIAPQLGHRALLVGGSGSVSLDSLIAVLRNADIPWEVFRVSHEPNISLIQDGLEKALSTKCDFVIGFGGGSVLDSAKAISALMTNPRPLMDYLEVIGGGQSISNLAAPLIALPTTAGTGTEVTRNAVITSPEERVKVSMRSPKMIPTVAIVDPELTYSMPPAVTASTGMDALTQVIEAYVSSAANPLTDALAREAIPRAARSLLLAYQNGQDRDAREDMALTSLFGGLVLANSGLGAVHGFAGTIGGMFSAPHGSVCASLLPAVMRVNVEALATQEAPSQTRQKYEDVAKWLTRMPDASIDDGVSWLKSLTTALQIPGLAVLGIKREDFPQIIAKSKVSSSMQKNPVKLDEEMLEAILIEAF